METVEVKCKIWKRKQTKTHLIQFQFTAACLQKKTRRSKSNPIELNFNRTQSNSIELNRWIEFDWVRQSNEIELTEK